MAARSSLTDVAHFADLYDRHAGDICRYVFRRTGDWTLAEDLAAAVFLEAWRRRGDVDLRHEHVRAWLFGVATNLVHNHRRSMRRHRAALRELAMARPTVLSAEEADDRRHDESEIRAILAAMKRLPRVEQDTIALVVWSGLSYEEAAAALRVPVGTVRSRLSRARARIRHDLDPTWENA